MKTGLILNLNINIFCDWGWCCCWVLYLFCVAIIINHCYIISIQPLKQRPTIKLCSNDPFQHLGVTNTIYDGKWLKVTQRMEPKTKWINELTLFWRVYGGFSLKDSTNEQTKTKRYQICFKIKALKSKVYLLMHLQIIKEFLLYQLLLLVTNLI